MDAEPTLADDEATFARVAEELLAALVVRVPEWLRRAALARDPEIDRVALDAAVDRTMATLTPALEAVLTADVDAGAGSPLATVRAAIGPVTELLLVGGVPPMRRDGFDVRAFPDDAFGLGPAAFSDIDGSLHEPGLVWGAARAHVHLRRRREAES